MCPRKSSDISECRGGQFLKYTSLKKTGDKLCFEALLLRDSGQCQRCGSTRLETLVPSHCYGKKAYPQLRHNLDNLLLLCNDCHANWWHLNPVEAWNWFMTHFPGRWVSLEPLKNKLTKLSQEHYREANTGLKTEIRRLRRLL